MHYWPFTVYLHKILGFCGDTFAANIKISVSIEIQP